MAGKRLGLGLGRALMRVAPEVDGTHGAADKPQGQNDRQQGGGDGRVPSLRRGRRVVIAFASAEKACRDRNTFGYI